MNTKTCTKCKETKETSEFSKDKSKKDGLRSSCKACKKAYDKKYVEENKEKKYAANYAYNASHRAEKAVYDKKRREAKKDEINKAKRIYWHFGGGKEKKKEWSVRNYDKVYSYGVAGSAKRRALLGKFNLSHAEFRIWKDAQPKVCTYCGTCCKDSFHVDHVIPLSKGGEHAIENLAIACPSCNFSKNNKLVEEWIKCNQELIEARDKKP